MKNKGTEDVSRRTFLSKGAAVAAVSTIIAIPAKSAPAPGTPGSTSEPMTNVPVYTESVQTLTNKFISGHDNFTGVDCVDVREHLSYPYTGTDISTALTAAIAALGSTGGKILIPRGFWTSNGGHEFSSSISIEGVGMYPDPNIAGTEIKLTGTGTSKAMFNIQAPRHRCSLKNLSINLEDHDTAIGLKMTNYTGTGTKIDPFTITGNYIYGVSLENVNFYGGAYGVKVDSYGTGTEATDFECTLTRFERVSFMRNQTGFNCNSVNGGYHFDTCYFSIPTIDGSTPAGIALDCYTMGNISLEHCIFVGNQTGTAGTFPTDGSILLKTTGFFNNISFYDCQDENIQYAYRNTTNDYADVALVFRNCLIQSKLYFTADGAVLFDSCRLTVPTSGGIEDSSGGSVKVYLKGINSVRHVNYTPAILGTFTNSLSRVFGEALEVGPPLVETAVSASYICNRTRGAVTIQAEKDYVTVENNLVTADSLVFAQLRTPDSNGARISHVTSGTGVFEIHLTQAAADDLSVAFKVEI